MFQESARVGNNSSLTSRIASLEVVRDKLQQSHDKLNKAHDELAERVNALRQALGGDEASMGARMVLLSVEKRLLDLLCLAAGHERSDYRRIEDVLLDIEEGTASPAVTKAWSPLKKYWPQREMRGLLRDLLSHSCVRFIDREHRDLDFYCTLSTQEVEEVLRKAALTNSLDCWSIPDHLINVVVELHALTSISADSSEQDDTQKSSINRRQ